MIQSGDSVTTERCRRRLLSDSGPLESGRIIVVKEWNVTTTCLASIKLNQLYLLYVIMRPSMLEPALRTATLSLCLSVPPSTCPPVCHVPVPNWRTKSSRRLKITTKYVHVMYITRVPFLGQGHLVNISVSDCVCHCILYIKNEDEDKPNVVHRFPTASSFLYYLGRRGQTLRSPGFTKLKHSDEEV